MSRLLRSSSEYEPQRRPFPRTWSQWRARIVDATRFGERISPPLVMGGDLIHRTILLVAIAAITGTFLASLTLPGVAVIGHTVGDLADRFSTPIGSIELPHIAQR